MTTENTPYDPCAEAVACRTRRNYHRTEEQKYSAWEAAAICARNKETSPRVAVDLTSLAEQCGLMRNHHARQAEQAAADLHNALARCNDLEAKNAAALRAAADTADMQGYPALAMELNRRAARVEGYDPDDMPATTEQPEQTPDPFADD